ncbi:MAG: hypothetical protein M1832_003410 [Thelocarpon impressellum]|nr:MAG: hypothetical protein M1832_003410 [Thelocarpon impressellum]
MDPDAPPTAAAAPQGPRGQRDELFKRLTDGQADDAGLLSQLKANPFFTAGFGLAALGATATLAQRGVRQAASLIKRHLTVDVEVSRNDPSYQWFLHWMTHQQRAQLDPPVKPSIYSRLIRRFTPRVHQVSIQTSEVSQANGSVHTAFSLVPGPGRHVLRYGNAFIAVTRTRETKAMDLSTGTPWETISLTTLYAHRHIFEDMFKEARALAVRQVQGKTTVFTSWATEWRPFGQPEDKRPLDSVILDRGVKERILADVHQFLESGKWYLERGVPYRRGYLLHGPPGSGKSSFIQALAGELDYNIALVNLSERGLTDDRLKHILSVLPPRTLALLEDVDAAFTKDRRKVDGDGYAGANVSFSGLLNALDGVASGRERVIFLTTNHVDRLNEALVRPGRVDVTVRLGEVTRWQAGGLWDRFYGDLDGAEAEREAFLSRLEALSVVGPEDASTNPSSPTSAAALQGLFLLNKGNMEGAIHMADGLVTRDEEEEEDEEEEKEEEVDKDNDEDESSNTDYEDTPT